MKEKFDLYKELKENCGFVEGKTPWGSDLLTKTYEKEVDVLWCGVQKVTMDVRCHFSSDHSSVQVSYYQGKNLMKNKVHLNDRRAFNGIKETLRLKEWDL